MRTRPLADLHDRRGLLFDSHYDRSNAEHSTMPDHRAKPVGPDPFFGSVRSYIGTAFVVGLLMLGGLLHLL